MDFYRRNRVLQLPVILSQLQVPEDLGRPLYLQLGTPTDHGTPAPHIVEKYFGLFKTNVGCVYPIIPPAELARMKDVFLGKLSFEQLHELSVLEDHISWRKTVAVVYAILALGELTENHSIDGLPGLSYLCLSESCLELGADGRTQHVASLQAEWALIFQSVYYDHIGHACCASTRASYAATRLRILATAGVDIPASLFRRAFWTCVDLHRENFGEGTVPPPKKNGSSKKGQSDYGFTPFHQKCWEWSRDLDCHFSSIQLDGHWQSSLPRPPLFSNPEFLALIKLPIDDQIYPVDSITLARLRAKYWRIIVATELHFVRRFLAGKESVPAETAVNALYQSLHAFSSLPKRFGIVDNVFANISVQFSHILILHAVECKLGCEYKYLNGAIWNVISLIQLYTAGGQNLCLERFQNILQNLLRIRGWNMD